MYEIVEITNYGEFVLKIVGTEEEAKAEVDRLNSFDKCDFDSYGYREIGDWRSDPWPEEDNEGSAGDIFHPRPDEPLRP